MWAWELIADSPYPSKLDLSGLAADVLFSILLPTSVGDQSGNSNDKKSELLELTFSHLIPKVTRRM